jgi:hypothetical protein
MLDSNQPATDSANRRHYLVFACRIKIVQTCLFKAGLMRKHLETDSFKAVRARKIQSYFQKYAITNSSMGHLGCLHSISAERPVKNHFRSVSIELARAARAQHRAYFFRCFRLNSHFVTASWQHDMSIHYSESQFGTFTAVSRLPCFRCRRSFSCVTPSQLAIF